MSTTLKAKIVENKEIIETKQKEPIVEKEETRAERI
jgi:hypothetical protein